MKEVLRNLAEEHKRVFEDFVSEDNNLKKIEEISEEIVKCLKSGKKIIIFGNGGSSADAQHWAAEITGRFEKERKGFSAISLPTNMAAVTAIANDYGYEDVFAREVNALAQEGDVLIGISTSGNSSNVVKGLVVGKEKKAVNVSLTGRDGGKCKELSDFNINVNFGRTARIQEVHLWVYHVICGLVEDKMIEN